MEPLTPAEALMAEVAANIEALVEHTLEQVAQPPRGTVQETGHFRALNATLKRKEMDALQRLLDDLAYNVAATVFATLDGAIPSDLPDFPRLALVEQGSATPIATSLHQAFAEAWESDEGEG